MDIQPCMKTRYIYKNNSNEDTIDVNSIYDSISKNIPYEIGNSSNNIINNDNTHYVPHQVEEEISPPSIIPDLQPITNEENDDDTHDTHDDHDYPDDEDYHTHYHDHDLDTEDNTVHDQHHKSTPLPKSVNQGLYNHRHTPLPTNIPTPTHMIQGHNGLINHLHHPYSNSKKNNQSKSPNYGRLTKNTKHQGMYKYTPLEFKHPNSRKNQNKN